MMSLLPLILLCVAVIVLGASHQNLAGWIALGLAVLALVFAVIPHFPH